MARAENITAVDLSGEMLAKAASKIQSDKVSFVQADILEDWTFADLDHDLVTFSLILEHVQHLSPVFQKASALLHSGGYVYVGELHPFKQYSGSQARFDTDKGTHVVPCFTHHLSDFTEAAKRCGLTIELLHEYFDDSNASTIPRILVLLLKKI